MDPERKLDFAVIGGQKCATSWLYYCLKEHPRLQLPNDKREIAYIGGEMFRKEGADWFFERYPNYNADLLRGDVSVDYLPDLNSAESLQPYVDRPRFIAVLRNPVDRMISAYFWSVRVGQLPNLPINEALDAFANDEPGFPRHRDNRYLDELVRRGCYGQQLRPYLERYGPESLLVLLYEDIQENALESVRKIYRFLEVDDSFIPESIDVRPKVNSYNRFLIGIQNAIPFGRRPVAKVLDHINRLIAPKERPSPLDVGLRQRLANGFRPHVQETMDVLDQLPARGRPDDFDLLKRWSIPELLEHD